MLNGIYIVVKWRFKNTVTSEQYAKLYIIEKNVRVMISAQYEYACCICYAKGEKTLYIIIMCNNYKSVMITWPDYIFFQKILFTNNMARYGFPKPLLT